MHTLGAQVVRSVARVGLEVDPAAVRALHGQLALRKIAVRRWQT